MGQVVPGPWDHVPSPADATRQTAEEFLEEIAERGGRIFRMIEPPRVFVLTTDETLAADIQRRGGRPHMPAHLREQDLLPRNSYRRTKEGIEEWDIEIGACSVGGEQTIWEAAGRYRGESHVG